MHSVLIVEDDSSIVELLKIHLGDLSCAVQVAADGAEGLQLAQGQVFDLIILDLMLPGGSGMEICRRLRHENCRTPILILSAKSEEIDKVLGLESGADDYLTKPFSIPEFIARVKVIFRRSKDAAQTKAADTEMVIRAGGLEIDIDKRKVSLQDIRVDLTQREFDLIVLLASNPGKSYSRKRLLNIVWGYDFEGYEHTVNSHINRLRGKIELDIAHPKFILTTWGVGYRFNEEL